LPRTIRQLRQRQGNRVPFLVQDEADLEDLLRSLLPLSFDDVRLESRTPRYAARTRTDFRIHPDAADPPIALSAKCVSPAQRERQLTEQVQEDVAYYQRFPTYRILVEFLYDPEGLLRTLAWPGLYGDLELRGVVVN
jgi:hypothetical protein